MNRVLVFCSICVVLIGGLMSGCKDGVSQTELEKFVAEAATLEGQARQDTLRHLAAGPAPYNSYANFLLGNDFYDVASDSAAGSNGWSNPAALAMLDSAEVYFNLAVAQDSTFIEPMVNLGSVWDDRAETMGDRDQYTQRLTEAEKMYKLALKVDYTNEKARCNLGSLYLRQRRTGDALAEFEKTLKYNPKSALAHYNMAIMFAESKIYGEALAEWELASKLDPDGDIGDRSRDNIEIVKDLMNTPTPPLGK